MPRLFQFPFNAFLQNENKEMSKNTINRRMFLKSAAVATAGGLLAACTPASVTEAPKEEAPDAQAPATEGALVRMWSGWGGEGYQTCWDEIQKLDGFKQILGNNTFEVKLSVEGEAMLTAVAGGDPPDTGTNIQYLDFMARGALMPLTNYLATSTETKEDKFLGSVWNLGFYKGVQYGFPSQEAFLRYGLNYNSALVEEAGLDPNAPPETWDELLVWQETLTTKDSAGNLTRVGINPYGAMGEGLWDTDGWLAPISWNWEWFEDATGKFNLNNEQMADVFATFKKFIDVAGVDNLGALYSAEGRDTWGGAYNGGVECALLEGYWHPGETAFAAPDISKVNRASWLPVPASRKGTKVQLAGGHVWTIFNDAKNPEISFKIGEFLNTNEPSTIIWNNQGWLPATNEFINSVDPNTYPGLDFYFKSAKEATEWHSPARCEITAFVSNEYLAIKDQVNRSELTPEQAAEEMQKRCEEEYKNAGFAS
jgi:maltose-binding protein MalE